MVPNSVSEQLMSVVSIGLRGLRRGQLYYVTFFLETIYNKSVNMILHDRDFFTSRVDRGVEVADGGVQCIAQALPQLVQLLAQIINQNSLL